ncbi:MAG: squalene/phytoene synthase family protein [Gammaproteobacteria bacterium]|nr:squalene/phytoene synthase family protein [Gammaproteobacteria bacterium]
MTTIESETAPRGSSLYYSLLKAEEPARQTIIALQAYADELRKISERFQEPSVAALKLSWWNDEIERLFNNEARHPITLMLQPQLSRYALQKAPFLALIEASQLSLTTEAFETQADLAVHYQHTGGIIESTKCQVILAGERIKEVEQFAHHIGICLESIRHIDQCAEFWNRQRIYLPITDIDSAEFDASKLPSLLKIQAEFARDCYTEALAKLPPAYAKKLKPIRLYASLQLLLLGAIERDGFRVLEHRMQLSPIRKLWHSIWFS